MKASILLAVFLSSTLCLAQALETKGEIRLGPSIPDTLGFIITGEPARLIYEKLSAAEHEAPYYGPGNVKQKQGEGIGCWFPKDRKIGPWCELTVTANGVLSF
jgi:hypothetical protein